MLWNPKHDQKKVAGEEVLPEVFSLEGLIAWLRGQDPETTYDYCNPENCLLARWSGLRGLDPFQLEDVFGRGIERIAVFHPWTYGAALSRAEKILESRSWQ